MTVFIVGLGLMGASYALGLKNKGYKVYGFDKDSSVLDQALKDELILSGELNNLKESELVILCLYPKDNIEFVKEHINLFNKQLITDIAGTKVKMIEELESLLPKDARYVSHHPMAGRENSGYKYHETKMFLGANFLIVNTKLTNGNDIEIIKQLGVDLGFKKITVIDPLKHDKLIAHTSQLTHLLAVSLMLNQNLEQTKNATGDSFRDLTRIAKINEEMWTELFLENKQVLVNEIDLFIDILDDLKELIKNDKKSEIKQILKEAKEKRLSFDDTKNG